MSKLTPHVPGSLIAAAKREAARREVSVSKVVSDDFRSLAASASDHVPGPVPPITASLVGCLKGKDPDAEHEAYIDHLEQKHS